MAVFYPANAFAVSGDGGARADPATVAGPTQPPRPGWQTLTLSKCRINSGPGRTSAFTTPGIP